MNVPSDLVTVYRSADLNADQDAAIVVEKLMQAGLHPEVFGDDVPGVVSGTFEVRVPAAEAAEAERFINSKTEAELEAGDESHLMDLETVAASDGALSEMEAQSIQALLRSNGYSAVIIGTTTLPNLGFEVRVPHSEAEGARQVIAEARSAGPAGAEEAEQATEGQPVPEP